MKQLGYTLLELMFAIAILGVVASIAVPSYQNFYTKSQLTELEVRVDALRQSAMIAKAVTPDKLINFSSSPGVFPAELEGILEPVSMTYPDIKMQLIHTSKTIMPFSGGEERPYLLLIADNSVGSKKLTFLSELLPDSIWGWWLPSVGMVISLTETAGNTNNIIGGSSTQLTTVAQQIPQSTPQPTGQTAPQTTSQANPQAVPQTIPSVSSTSNGTSTSTSSPATVQSQQSSSHGNSGGHGNSGHGNHGNHNNQGDCIHPGNGHAYGRCNNN